MAGGRVVDQQGVNGGHTRLDRLESDVITIRGEMGGLKTEMAEVKSDVRGLGAILSRIEQGVTESQRQASTRELAGRPNLMAIISVLVTIISILVGGAWLVGGSLARLEERSIRRDVEAQRMWVELDRASRAQRKDVVEQYDR